MKTTSNLAQLATSKQMQELAIFAADPAWLEALANPPWMQALELATPGWMKELAALADPTKLQALASMQALAPASLWMNELATFAKPISKEFSQSKKLRDAGWMPHPLLPLDILVGDETDITCIRRNGFLYLDGHKESICVALLNRLCQHDDCVPGTARVAKDAMAAFRQKLFTLIVPALMPLIERAARDVVDVIDGKGKPLQKLIQTAWDLGISKGQEIIETVSVLEEDYCPNFKNSLNRHLLLNRNGSLHGLKEYDTERDCLNAMLLLDSVIRICEILYEDRS